MTTAWLVGGLLLAACLVATWLWARSAPTIVPTPRGRVRKGGDQP